MNPSGCPFAIRTQRWNGQDRRFTTQMASGLSGAGGGGARAGWLRSFLGCENCLAVLLCPLREQADRAHQRAAEFGELVLDAARDAAVVGTGDQTVGLQAAQRLGEDLPGTCSAIRG